MVGEQRRKYQVFVSSTYEDLRGERREVIQTLLELDCIPAGMELFPAAEGDPLTEIKKVIDDSDYYIVIVAGKNGSLALDGKSFTQSEYEYALSRNIPILAFLRSDIDALDAERLDKGDARKHLDEFRNLLTTSKLCRFWSTPAELAAGVTRSLMHLFRNHPATGWIRADTPDLVSKVKLLELSSALEPLKRAGLRDVFTRPYDEVPWSDLFRSCKKLNIFFAYGRTWRNAHTDDLESLARTPGALIRVVLPDFRSEQIMCELARRFKCTLDDVKRRVSESADDFEALKTIEGSCADIAVHFVEVAPLFTFYLFESMGVLCNYSHRGSRTGVMTFMLERGALLSYLADEFYELCKKGHYSA